MGRGRAKAKQAKVARRLKYSGAGTDLQRLRRELGVDTSGHEEAQRAETARADADDADAE